MYVKSDLFNFSVSLLALSLLSANPTEAMDPMDIDTPPGSPRREAASEPMDTGNTFSGHKRKKENEEAPGQPESKKHKALGVKVDDPATPEPGFCGFGPGADETDEKYLKAIKAGRSYTPKEILEVEILPHLGIREFLNFCSTNKTFQKMSRDPLIVATLLARNAESCWWSPGPITKADLLNNAGFQEDPYKYLQLANREPLFKGWTVESPFVFTALFPLPLETITIIASYCRHFFGTEPQVEHYIIQIINSLIPLAPAEIAARREAITANAQHFLLHETDNVSRALLVSDLARIEPAEIAARGQAITTYADVLFDFEYDDGVMRSLVCLNGAQINAIGENANHFFPNKMFGVPHRVDLMKLLATLEPAEIAARGEAITDHTETFYTLHINQSEYDTCIDLPPIIMTLASLAPAEIAARAEAIIANRDHFFTADMEEQYKGHITTALTTLNPVAIAAFGEAITANAAHYFTPDMNGNSRADIIHKLASVAPEEIAARGEAITANAALLFTPVMNGEYRSHFISAFVGASHDKFNILIQNAGTLFHPDMRLHERLQAIWRAIGR